MDETSFLPGDAHDAETIANTRPPDWTNPTPRPRYDLVLVGGGTAGLVGAGTASLLGARVALVERAHTGGDCLIAGCVPSKALLRAARAAAEARDAGRFGVKTGGVDIDFAAAMEHVRSARRTISRADAARAFADEYGVDVFFAAARFTGPDALAAGDTTLRFRRALIATGSRPKAPDVPGLAEAGYLTNETVFTLTRRPDRLAVLGGGPLGCELAQAFARLGSRVTLIEHNDRFLPREAPDAAAVLRAALERDGVVVCTGTTVTRAERAGDETTLTFGPGDTLVADAVLVGVGRVPDLSDLGLNAAGVKHDEHGVTVDDYLRTSNRRVFAAGDACLRERFTHAADASARLAVQNALLFRGKRWSRQAVPHVTYTEPELAQVGPVDAGDAKGCKTYQVPLGEVDRAVTDGATDGFVRISVHRRSGRVRGATIVGPRAGELLTTVLALMHARRPLSMLAGVVVPYPTHGDALKECADAALRDRLSGWPLRAARWWVRR